MATIWKKGGDRTPTSLKSDYVPFGTNYRIGKPVIKRRGNWLGRLLDRLFNR